MFFTEYDPLTTEFVDRAVIEKAAPDGKDTDCLSGLSFACRLTGEYAPEGLSYTFTDEKTLYFTLEGNE